MSVPRVAVFAAAVAVIVTVGVSRWLRRRKEDRQWAETVAALVRARETRVKAKQDEIAVLEALYAAESHQEER